MVSIGEAFSYVFGGRDQHKMIPKRLNWTLPVDRRPKSSNICDRRSEILIHIHISIAKAEKTDSLIWSDNYLSYIINSPESTELLDFLNSSRDNIQERCERQVDEKSRSGIIPAAGALDLKTAWMVDS